MAGDEAPECQAAPAQSHTKPCKSCGEEIKISATKCIHCDSFQDWRSGLSFGSTVLSLLVALVSVLTFAVPIWKREFYTPTPQPSVAVTNFAGADGKIHLVISNGGDAPMSVSRADITFNGHSLPLVLNSGNGQEIIKQNEAITFYVTSDKLFFIMGAENGLLKKEEKGGSVVLSREKMTLNNCRIVVNVVAPGGQQYAPYAKVEDRLCDFIFDNLLNTAVKSAVP